MAHLDDIKSKNRIMANEFIELNRKNGYGRSEFAIPKVLSSEVSKQLLYQTWIRQSSNPQ